MYVNKWYTFSVSIVCNCSAGLAYCFSLYSNDLKQAFGYDQSQIQAVGSAINLGGYLSVLSGLFYDSWLAYDRLGPRLTVFVGACVNLVGFVLLWAAAKGLFHAPFWLVLLIAGLSCNGGTWLDTACLVTNVRNFPNERGTVVGLLKSCVGLSASIYTAIYVGFLEPHAITFLLCMAFIPAGVALLSIPFLNHVPFVQQSEVSSHPQVCTTGGRFLFGYQIVAAISIYSMTTAVMDHSPTLTLDPQTRKLLSVGTLILLASVLLSPIGSGGFSAKPAHPRHDEEDTRQEIDSILAARGRGPFLERDPNNAPSRRHAAPDEHAPLLDQAATEAAEEDDVSDASSTSSIEDASPSPKAPKAPSSPQKQHPDRAIPRRPVPGAVSQRPGPRGHGAASAPATGGHVEAMPDMTLLQCCGTLDYWLLFVTCAIGMGSGLAFLNNLGQLVLALGGEANSQALFVSLFSVSNCGGRLLLGYIPERCLHARGTPRCMFMVLVSLVSALTVCFNAFASLAMLFPASLLAGVAFGAHWSLMATLTSELFGLRHFASNYTFIQLAPAAGGLGLGQIVGWLYEAEAHKEGPSSACHGPHCYRSSFTVIAVLDLVALACSIVLFFRTQHIYRLEYLELHLHDEEMHTSWTHGGQSATQFGGANLGHVPSYSDSESEPSFSRSGRANSHSRTGLAQQV